MGPTVNVLKIGYKPAIIVINTVKAAECNHRLMLSAALYDHISKFPIY